MRNSHLPALLICVSTAFCTVSCRSTHPTVFVEIGEKVPVRVPDSRKQQQEPVTVKVEPHAGRDFAMTIGNRTVSRFSRPAWVDEDTPVGECLAGREGNRAPGPWSFNGFLVLNQDHRTYYFFGGHGVQVLPDGTVSTARILNPEVLDSARRQEKRRINKINKTNFSGNQDQLQEQVTKCVKENQARMPLVVLVEPGKSGGQR